VSNGPDERAPVRGCDGCVAEPAEPGIDNRPGLLALRYRIGTFRTFLARMLTDLPREKVTDDGLTPLASLNTRAADDHSVALVDAWAVVADVLTFYQERIANEGFLRTAVERGSVLELARSIGYELVPGVAASTYLAFNLDDTPAVPLAPGGAAVAPEAPRTAQIPIGSQVQSIPGPGQLPQIFETVEDLLAHVEWNRLQPRRTQAQSFALGSGIGLLDSTGKTVVPANRLYLAGTSTGLKPGDVVLAVAGGATRAARVLAVEVDDDAKQTIIHIAAGAAPAVPTLPSPAYPPPATTGKIELQPLPLDAKTVSDRILSKVWDDQSLSALCRIQRWDPAELLRVVAGILLARAASSKLFAFRQRLACFGHNAPPYAQVRLQPVPQPATIKMVLDWYAPSSLASYQADEDWIAQDIVSELTAQPAPTPTTGTRTRAPSGRTRTARPGRASTSSSSARCSRSPRAAGFSSSAARPARRTRSPTWASRRWPSSRSPAAPPGSSSTPAGQARTRPSWCAPRAPSCRAKRCRSRPCRCSI
jgi:hypothetical protein